MKTINETNYVDEAEKVIKALKEKKDKRGRDITMVTTSKIRNLLSMTSDIYNNVLNLQENELNTDLISRIEYLRMRFVYESGREPKVKDLVDSAHILDILKEIKNSKDSFMLFSHYMEALVAFHRYYGGKD